MSQGYVTANGDDEGRRLTKLTAKLYLQERRRDLRAQIAGCCLAQLLPSTSSPEKAVGDALAATDLLLRRLEET